MTVEQLADKLMYMDPNAIVVLSTDEEGNSYHPLSIIEGNHTYANNEIGFKELNPTLIKNGYSEEDIKEGQDCIVLYP